MSEDTKEKWELFQLRFNVFKDIGLLILFLTLLITALVNPDALKTFLRNIGLKEVQTPVGTLEIAESTEKNYQDLKDAKFVINDLVKQLDETGKKLANQGQDDNKITKEQIKDQLEKNSEVVEAAKQIDKTIKNTIDTNAALIEQSQEKLEEAQEKLSTVTGFENKWGIVIGADISEDAAMDEVRDAEGKGLDNVQLYFRKNYYRTVAIFNSREEANRQLNKAQKVNSGAYIVNLPVWCTNPQDISNQQSTNKVYKCLN